MRIQVAVLRHDLPEVRLIFNTASKPGPGIARLTTIADLISAINSLVQIESPDGSWGLEDYVVEVAATGDQPQAYECFHYQEINDVLREDDEVVIRGITTEELRHRRQGGRLQITSDGRHLIDGLSWGRRWRAGVGVSRPHFNIPPRKRRRMIEPEPEPTSDEEISLELEYPSSRQLVPFVNDEDAHADEDDEEDDEDYEDYEEEEEEESDESEEESEYEDDKTKEKPSENQTRQVTAKATFQNSDFADEAQSDEMNTDEEIEEELLNGVEEMVEETAKPGELAELAMDADTVNVDMSKRGRAKRKSYFEEHPSPLIRPEIGDENGVQDSAADLSQLVDEVNETSITDMFVFKGGSGGDVIITAQNPEDEPKALSNGVVHESSHLVLVPAEDNDGKHSASSSEDESSEEDSDVSSSSSDSESESSSDEDDDDDDLSDESSDSGESTSSSDSSLSSVRSATKPASPPKLEMPGGGPQKDHPPNDPKTLPHKNNPPGTGQTKTKRNNERKRFSKLLSNLKEAGKLDQDADFKALREYLAETTEEVMQESEVEVNETQTVATQDKISARAEEILARLNKAAGPAIPTSQDADGAIIAPDPQTNIFVNVVADLNSRQDESTTNTDIITHSDSPANPATDVAVMSAHMPTSIPQESNKTSSKRPQQEPDETPSKRVRLDVAASRRMLFNSLGVRNPKTAEAENALREKLAKPVRQVKNKAEEQKEERAPKVSLAQGRWKTKFTVLAVECIQDWKKIEPPPFPFKQPWLVRKERDETFRAARQQETYEGGLNYDDVEEDQDTQPMDMDTERFDDRPSQSMTTSKTLTTGTGTTAEDDELAEPSDFSLLPALTEFNLSQATVIAYKELHMNARFEPEQSSYRVARIVSQAEGAFQLRVAPKYRRQGNIEYDEETGERQYNRFEMPTEDDDEPDDGFREVEFSQMIDPKIVVMSDVDDENVEQGTHQENPRNHPVPAEPSLRGGNLDDAAQQISQPPGPENNVSTPRRAEINTLIKEAGFDSAVDGQLLQGLTEAAAQSGSSPAVEDESMVDDDATRTHVWQSDSLQATSPAQANVDSSTFRESSVPSESMVESVKYPYLSQLEVDTPAAAQSSSHQDAQKPIPIPILPAEESTNLEIALQESADRLDPEPDSLPSEVPQTQSQDIIPDSLDPKQQHESRALSASPLPNIDADFNDSISPKSAHADPDNEDDDDDDDDDDDESIDSNGFPSIRSLTSSQACRTTTTDSTATDRKSTINKLRNSPPEPTRRSLRTRKATARSSDWSDTENTQPQRSFKASQSQPQRLSQIPDDTIYVDLTQSSPSNSPDKDKDKDKGDEREPEKVQKAGARKLDKDRVENGGGGTGGPSNIFRKSFEGLGEKSHLKRKKKSL